MELRNSDVAARRAAVSLASSDDLLRRICALLPLDAKLRLQAVSMRWHDALLADLRFPLAHVWRAPRILHCGGGRVLRLDVSSLRTSASCSSTLFELVRGITAAGAAAAELRSITMWSKTDFALGDRRIFAEDSALTKAQASQLVAACPKLDASTRLVVCEVGAVRSEELLNVLPGRTALILSPPLRSFHLSGDFPEASLKSREDVALKALARSPRLACLSVKTESNDSRWFADLFYEAFAFALCGNLSPLEYLSVEDHSRYSDDPAALAVLPPADAYGGDGAAAAGRLQALHIFGCSPPNAFTHVVLAACGRGLRHLSLYRVADYSDPAAAALAALLNHIGPSLESLDFGRGYCYEPGLPGLASFLSSDRCGLRSLALPNVLWRDRIDCDKREELALFAKGLAANWSLWLDEYRRILTNRYYEPRRRRTNPPEGWRWVLPTSSARACERPQHLPPPPAAPVAAPAAASSSLGGWRPFPPLARSSSSLSLTAWAAAATSQGGRTIQWQQHRPGSHSPLLSVVRVHAFYNTDPLQALPPRHILS